MACCGGGNQLAEVAFDFCSGKKSRQELLVKKLASSNTRRQLPPPDKLLFCNREDTCQETPASELQKFNTSSV